MRILRSSRALAALLLAILLAGRMAVPAGWMPVRTADGFSVMLCSGSGPAGGGQAWVDSSGTLHHGQKPAGHGETKDPCPFGAVSAPVALAMAPAIPPLLPAAAPPAAPPPQSRPKGRGLAAPPPPATGPPLSA